MMTALPALLYNLDSFLIIFLILGGGFLVYRKKPSRVLDYALSVMLTAGASEMIKYYVNKPRPFSDYIFEGSSFPSSHSAVAASVVFFYLLVCHTLSKNLGGLGKEVASHFISREGIISGILIVIGATVAWLRYYLGAHDFTDIFAGIGLGYVGASLFIFYDISGRRVK